MDPNASAIEPTKESRRRAHSVSGRIGPGAAIELGPGDAWVVRQRERHRLTVVEPALLVRITPEPSIGR
jgi:hypothetical protein